jgi:hypothetical protein
MQNTYLVIGRDEEGNKIKMTPEDILMDKEDMRPAEKNGPEFIKRNQNSLLYKAQMFWNCVNKIKPKNICPHSSSKVKGFMWLFCSHALPVGTRL